MPFKDMLITPEHCLFLDDCFVPARMLVNGQSIFYDQSFTHYDYYHVETEDHAIIIADGVLTESYLDTGNRHKFRQDGDVLSIARGRNLTWDDAAAPLNVSRAFVEPLFQKLSLRAEEKSVPFQTAAAVLTHDNDLHLKSDTGHTLYPIRKKKNGSVFMLPEGVKTVHIISNVSRPCDAIGPFVDDRRALGVLVGNITLCEKNATRTITSHLDDENLTGWNSVESPTMRWTSGNAYLALGDRKQGAIGFLTLQILASGPYLVRNTVSEDAALRA
nr:Hint domain-containing protein [Acetobacter cibinongensis]